jgi:hypothetical protein
MTLNSEFSTIKESCIVLTMSSVKFERYFVAYDLLVIAVLNHPLYNWFNISNYKTLCILIMK